MGLGGLDHSVKNPPIVLQSALCIHGSTPKDSTSLELCITVVCIYWKYPHISEPLKFTPVLFKGPLYLEVHPDSLAWLQWQ